MREGLSIVGYGKNRAVADFYPTPDYATEELLKRERFEGSIWECACGDGAIAKFFPTCKATDLRTDLGYGQRGVDFLKTTDSVDNIITNPPYSLGQEFVEHALECANKKVVMLLKLVFLESVGRKPLFDRNMLKTVYVFRRRLKIYKDGIIGKNSGLIAYAWYIWDKEYNGKPQIEWI
jgi:hypothetical protein